MRPNVQQQLSRAAAMAGPAIVDPDGQAQRIVDELAPGLIAAMREKMAERLALVRTLRPEADEERAIMEACRAVGEALDRIDRARETGRPTNAARHHLEHEVRRLKALIDRREKRNAR